MANFVIVRRRNYDLWDSLLEDEDHAVRLAAGTLLANAGKAASEPDVISSLAELARRRDGVDRRYPLWVLGKLGEAAVRGDALEAVDEGLQDGDMEVRRWAAWAVGCMGPRALSPGVLAGLLSIVRRAVPRS